MRCFERAQPAAAEAAANGTDAKETVYSDVPEESAEKAGRITWYRGIRQDMGREKLPRQKAVAVSAWQEGQAPATLQWFLSQQLGTAWQRLVWEGNTKKYA